MKRLSVAGPNLNPLVLAVVLLVGAGEYVVHAASTRPVRPDASATANVDMQRVFESSDARKTAEQHVQDYGTRVGQHFQEIARLNLLTAQEVSELSAAMNAPTPSDADTKKISDIKAAAAQRETEFQTLAAKKQTDLTAADRARLRELGAMQQERSAIQDRLERVYQAAVNDFEASETRKGMAQVRQAVGKLAKEQGITEVYDTSSLVVAPVDLTDQAVKRVTSAPGSKHP